MEHGEVDPVRTEQWLNDHERGTVTVCWVHVAGTWDGSDVRLFTDGVQVAFGANVFTTIADTTVNVNIGAFQAFASGARSAFFDGIDRRGVPVRPCPHRS